MSGISPNQLEPQHRTSQRDRVLMAASLALVALVTLLVYLPGISGPFLLDDNVNLQQLGEGDGITGIQSAVNFIFGNRSGPLGRPVSLASFLLNARDWPADSASFKLTNVLLHVANGLLIAWLSLLLLRAARVPGPRASLSAVAIAALWLLHPLNVSTTLYVVQRMTQLTTLFSLAGLICYVKGRAEIEQRPLNGLLLMSVCLFPFGLLAVLSKENGALLLLAILVVEFTFFAQQSRSLLHRAWLSVAVAAPLGVVIVYLAVSLPSRLNAFTFREYSLVERLLTESRIVIDYLFNILVPQIRDFSLQHDDVVISRGLLDPVSTVICLGLVIALLAVGVTLRKTQPVVAFAVFWFFGWHLLESTFLPLELYFEHRNYLPMIGPLFAAVYYVGSWLVGAGVAGGSRLAGVAGGLVIAVLALLTLQLSSLWGNNMALAAHWAEQHPASYRAQVEYAFLEAETGRAGAGYERIAALQERYPREVALQLMRWNFACTYGLPAPYRLQDVATSTELVYYRADLTAEVKTLVENLVATRCNYPGRQEMVSLMERLAEVPMRTFENSGFHLLFSDLYVHYRLLNPALIQLREAFELRPDPGFPIRQAVLSASAGNYEDSLAFLQRAREADQNRGALTPSRMAEIEEMEQGVRARLGLE